MHGNMGPTAAWARVCYGIDLQEAGPVLVRGERTRGRLEISRVEPGSVDLQAVAAGRTVTAAAVSVRESVARWIEAPFSSSAKAIKVFPTLLDVQLPFPLEDCSAAYLNVERVPGDAPAGDDDDGAPRRGTRGLAVVVRRLDLDRRLSSLEEEGINPCVLDHEGLALWSQSLQECPDTPGGEPGPRILLHVDTERSTLVVGVGARFLAAHGVQTGDFARIRRLINAAIGTENATGGAVRARWFWSGPGAEQDGLAESQWRAVSVDCPGELVIHDSPAEFLARALVRRALLAGPSRCNLRGVELAHPLMVQREARRNVQTAVAVLACGLLLCAVNVGARVLAARRMARAGASVSALADELAGYHVKGKGKAVVKIVGDEVAKRKDELRPFARAFEPSQLVTLIDVLEVGKRHMLRFETLTLEDGSVTINGTAGDWNSCDELVARLEGYGMIVNRERRDLLADERIPFTIEAEVPE